MLDFLFKIFIEPRFFAAFFMYKYWNLFPLYGFLFLNKCLETLDNKGFLVMAYLVKCLL